MGSLIAFSGLMINKVTNDIHMSNSKNEKQSVDIKEYEGEFAFLIFHLHMITLSMIGSLQAVPTEFLALH